MLLGKGNGKKNIIFSGKNEKNFTNKSSLLWWKREKEVETTRYTWKGRKLHIKNIIIKDVINAII